MDSKNDTTVIKADLSSSLPQGNSFFEWKLAARRESGVADNMYIPEHSTQEGLHAANHHERYSESTHSFKKQHHHPQHKKDSEKSQAGTLTASHSQRGPHSYFKPYEEPKKPEELKKKDTPSRCCPSLF